jgi:multicomponent Na+:H+ antiporter subunit D
VRAGRTHAGTAGRTVDARKLAAWLRQPPEQDEERIERDVTPPLMLVVPSVPLLGAVVVGLVPGVVPAIERAAAQFTDHAAYATWVLRGHPAHYAAVPPSHIEPFDYAYAAASTLGALALAALTLFRARLRGRAPSRFEGPPRAALAALRRLHSGHIGDCIAWWTAAAAMLGGASLILLT